MNKKLLLLFLLALQFSFGQNSFHKKYSLTGDCYPITTLGFDSFTLTGDSGLVTSEMVPASVIVDGEERIGGTGLADYR